jgi:hypothetical protein
LPWPAEKEPTYGLHKKKQMPFFRMLKRESFGENALDGGNIASLVALTQHIYGEVERELKLKGFWESIPARNKLRSDIQKVLSQQEFSGLPGLVANRAQIISRVMEIAEKQRHNPLRSMIELGYRTVRSSKRKKLTITVERDRAVVVQAPEGISDREIQKIVDAKRQWILSKLNTLKSIGINYVRRERKWSTVNPRRTSGEITASRLPRRKVLRSSSATFLSFHLQSRASAA